jgi:hypothetical protein
MLKKWLARLTWALIALVLVLGPFVGMFSSKNFQYCSTHQGDYPTAQNDEHKTPAVFVPEASNVRIFWQCAGGFANDNGTAITALATVLLTIVTSGLVLIGYRQIKTTRAELRAYIFVEFSGIQDGATLPNAPIPVAAGCPNSHVVIKNSGQTPLTMFIISARL